MALPVAETQAVDPPPAGRMARVTSTTGTSGIGTTEQTHAPLTYTFEVTNTLDHRAIDVEVTGLRVAASAAPLTCDVYLDITQDATAIMERFGASVSLERSGGPGAMAVPSLRAPVNLPNGQYTARVKAKVTAGTGTLTLANTGGCKQVLTVTDVGPSV